MSPIIDKIKSVLHPSHDSAPAQSTPATSSSSTPAVVDTPAFDKDKVVVLFVLGGPGVGASSFSLPWLLQGVLSSGSSTPLEKRV